MAEETKPSAPENPILSPIVTTDEQNLVVAFLQFIRRKVSSNEATPEQAEALEVAIQCLEHSFALDDASYAFQPSQPILELFKSAEGLPEGESADHTPTEEEVAQANKLKEEGNDLMKASQFDAAIQKYNSAIKLKRDPVYFCNRAAAYCRLEQYDLAIQDCRTALALDSSYSKAWGRMGLAFSCQNRYQQAAEAYKKALEIEPNQESYKNNLKIAEDKIKELESARPAQQANPFAGFMEAMGGGMGNMPPGFGGMGGLLSDPGLMQAASQMMSDPNLSAMMNNMMSGQGSIADLMAAGQQMAARMQETNPELIENLRRQFGGGPGGPGADGGAPPNPPQ
ncbi:CBN-SGT-1 protein [Caenorhabditis brenneri]|uniref:CBN-SGT-1 protein n=1 Tax=Caenorhabditis brenneri TaxID=135651 RepID=G0PE36_CAEBE|nr:CBN-SGT-1 protein [Caenorhabditis brenneri]